MVYELERVLRMCNGFLCSMSVTYDGAALLHCSQHGSLTFTLISIRFILFAGVVDVVTEFAREGALSELLYADGLVLMNETIKGLRNKFLKWKVPLEI